MTDEQLAEMRAAAERQLELQGAAAELAGSISLSEHHGYDLMFVDVTAEGGREPCIKDCAYQLAELLQGGATDPSPANVLKLIAEVERLKSLSDTHRQQWQDADKRLESVNDVETTLGKALNYPTIYIDPSCERIVSPDYPNGVPTPDICIGEHTVETLAEEAARTIQTLRDKLEEKNAALEAAEGDIETLRRELSEIHEAWGM